MDDNYLKFLVATLLVVLLSKGFGQSDYYFLLHADVEVKKTVEGWELVAKMEGKVTS